MISGFPKILPFLLIPLAAPADMIFEMAPRAEATPPPAVVAPSPRERAAALLEDKEMTDNQRVGELRNLANAHPDDATIWSAYGEALDRAGDRTLALQAFERASRLDPSLYTPWLWLGLLAKRGNPDPDLPAAERAFRRALAEGAPKARALNELGVTLALQGKMEEAVRCWQQAINEDPDWGALYSNLLKAARSLRGRGDLMAEMAEKSLHAARFESSAVFIYADWLVNAGRAADAVAFYTRAIEVHPDNGMFQFQKAVALARAGQKDKALQELRRIHAEESAVDPLGEIAQYAHWELFKLEHPRDEAAFQEARRPIFTVEMDTRTREREMRRALQTLDGLVQKHPNLWNAWFVRSRALRMIGEEEAAEAGLMKVLELLPGEPNALLDLALLRRDQFRLAEAAELAEQAAERAPRDPLVAINAGLIMVDAGRCDRGWELYRRTIRMVGEEAAVVLRDQLEIKCGEAGR